MISLSASGDGAPRSRQQAVSQPPASRVVPKPVPESQAKDPRTYQIEQLRRRFSPKESTNASDNSTSLTFKLAPSDPDFPFELAYLDCEMRVPEAYPEERPALLVRNKDMPRGFAINIERGWQKLAQERSKSSLLALVHALDKNLESFLTEQKVETVKLVMFKDTRHVEAEAAKTSAVEPEAEDKTPPARMYVPEESYTRDQIAEAKARRAQEVRQIESRMGKMPMYRRSADGIVYTLPLEPKKRSELPGGLRPVRSLHLIVPLLYPLQNLRIQLNEVEAADAEPVEELFVEKAAGLKQMTLMSHLNYLAQNLHNLAKQASAPKPQVEPAQAQTSQQIIHSGGAGESSGTSNIENEKSHIQVIPRPPEWSVGHNEESGDSEDYTDSGDEGDGGAMLGGETESAQQPSAPSETAERGTMMSFPSVELHGIELLQVSILSISVKCERCKTLNDITGLKPQVEKTTSCKKCATPIAARFRPQLIHENSNRAGFIDLSGCKVADMLPSTLVPTCAKCSTDSPGLVSVRGETTTNVCRECHGKFTFKIPDIRFLFITPGSLPPPAAGARPKRERLGLHAGDPLPSKGACVHYRKSYRWFRFSCCNRVYPCDRCHEEAEDHSNEWANRMVCGWCSREQNYAVEACGFCGRSVIGRKGKGFWEGGKGTRDQRLMSRRDPRKYKRIGGGQASKKE
ncbi:hypothetical protein S40285_04111 [Stachybotrys chlorohalonatus IBT 40285]|uniref:CHY-type domain-containing protein n=1 Tax=Stachybotrys chlorohalonatus (strain IBT 40285) TaxID=1283841 RepID=A0A084QI09_STAC4|nr:hypothetical protein S40285_04111 [Stachybotrys chlorohalonata IBT 40285]